jgi:hypothetical protein
MVRRWCGNGYSMFPRAAADLCRDCQRLERNRRNAERRRTRPEAVVCPQCGETFAPTRADAVTCSDRCRQAAHRQRLAARAG